MNAKPRKLITTTDIVIIVTIFLLSGLFGFLFMNPSGKTAVITVDGAEVRRIDLDTAADEVITLDTDPQVKIRVEDGTIRFIDAKCPTNACQHRGKLLAGGEVAACVPAGVVISITSDGGSSDIDAVVG
ncbi:MAG: NusG domain II-containing protein [Clostridia bacterium]|nr:NusG domain II-containing protein [Clostridia bacterium]